MGKVGSSLDLLPKQLLFSSVLWINEHPELFSPHQLVQAGVP